MKDKIEMEKCEPACSAVENADKKEKGASLVEYVLLIALIAIICILAMRFLGTRASTQFSSVASQI